MFAPTPQYVVEVTAPADAHHAASGGIPMTLVSGQSARRHVIHATVSPGILPAVYTRSQGNR